MAIATEATDTYPGSMETEQSAFRMGRLDHVHIRVPDRDEAAAWYALHLGFEPVEQFDFWATDVDGGPLQISADGGETTLALFHAACAIDLRHVNASDLHLHALHPEGSAVGHAIVEPRLSAKRKGAAFFTKRDFLHGRPCLGQGRDLRRLRGRNRVDRAGRNG